MTGRKHVSVHHQQGSVRVRVGRYVAPAPAEPEHREYPIAPMPNVTVAEMIEQLRSDPEFVAWRQDEARGRLY